ncbi:tripartite motif-containing protein 16-like [Heptranchias perlo]|uniref:tripartite motif-containing protein 16-like n=1 Tax=Heptranchias perlo TaxID=212740 RepID=UPI00355A0630
MASSTIRSEDKFVCAICLEIFNNPTTIPCGHSFCLQCIDSYWEPSSSSDGTSCPQCLHSFTPKPTLHKNLILCEVLEDLRSSGKLSPGSPAGPGDVACDVCTETKLKARKSCLDCLLSYCQTHLMPHHKNPALGDHTLIDPVKHLNVQRSCPAHGKPLELFCRTEGMCICELCTTGQHVIHEMVTVEEEVNERKQLLLQKKSNLKEQLQKTLTEISNLQKNVDPVKNSSQKVRAEITSKFTAMIKVIEGAHKEVIGLIDNEERVALGQAESIRNQLQQRCTELRGNEHQLRTLSQINDNLIFLQNLLYPEPFNPFTDALQGKESSCLKASVQPLDFPQLKTDLQSALTYVNEAVTELATWIKQRVHLVSKQILDRRNIANPRIVKTVVSQPKTREDFLQFAQNLTFNINSANHCLRFYDGYQTVSHSIPMIYPDHKERFDFHPQILCENYWGLGKYYCEVELHKNKRTDHICVGITRPDINRKGNISSCILGRNNLSCCLDLHLTARNNFLVFLNGVESEIPSVSYNRIGIYLDDRTLSFYSVTDTMTLIYKFLVPFANAFYPAFRIEVGTSLTLCKLK